MTATKAKTIALSLALLGAGYVTGASLPPAQAYDVQQTRLLNRMVNELGGIRRELANISRRM